MFSSLAHYLPELSAEASIVALLVLAVLGVLLMRALRLPSMLAYLLIGVFITATGIDLLPGDDDVSEIGEFGIAFLMFSIGLEFNIAKLLQMRHLVLGLGPAQMFLTALGTMLVTWFGYDQGWRPGLAVGLAVAMSSTAIMAKLLSERFELHSHHGKRTMAVLLFQDLAVVPSLIIIPALAMNPDNLGRVLGISLIVTVATLLLMFWLGRKLVNQLFSLVSRVHSPELFMLTVLLLVFGLSFTTGSLGLSQAMGAFIGGILVSETMYRHEVEADIRPFRDIMLGLFFVSIGMMLDLRYVVSHIPIISLGLLLLILGKAAVVLLICQANKTPMPVAVKTAAQLGMAGEFGIVLLTLSFAHELINEEILQSTLAIMLLSMFMAPFVIQGAMRLAHRLEQSAGDRNGGRDSTLPGPTGPDAPISGPGSAGHVLICGFGRTGHAVAEFLAAEDMAWAAIDVNGRRVEEARHELGQVIFGRAERPEVLRAAGIDYARLVVICFPDPAAVERMLPAIRRTRPDVRIVVRVPDDSHRPHFLGLGATEVVAEVFESGLALAEEALRLLDIPVEKTRTKVNALRLQRYGSSGSSSQSGPA